MLLVTSEEAAEERHPGHKARESSRNQRPPLPAIHPPPPILVIARRIPVDTSLCADHHVTQYGELCPVPALPPSAACRGQSCTPDCQRLYQERPAKVVPAPLSGIMAARSLG